MYKLLPLLVLFLAQCSTIMAQDFHICNGKSVKFPQDFKDYYGKAGCSMAGYCGDKVVFTRRGNGEIVSKCYFDEKTNSVTDTFNIKTKDCMINHLMQNDNKVLMSGYYKLDASLQKSKSWVDIPWERNADIWICTDGSTKLLEKYKGDFQIYSTLLAPSLGERMTFSQFNYFEELNGDFDAVIEYVKDGAVSKFDIKGAMRPQIVNDTLYYAQRIDFSRYGTDAYEWQLYKAPMGNTKDRVLVAEYTQLLAVDETGRYILGLKELYGRLKFVMIDSYSKKLDFLINVLLPQEHLDSFDNAFYSKQMKKFCLVNKESFFYVDIPKVFTFNSVGYTSRAFSNDTPVQRYWVEQENRWHNTFWEDKFDLDPIPAEKPFYLRLEQDSLADTELQQMTKDELRIARNTIFARHGHNFKSADLQNYFKKFYWYCPYDPKDIYYICNPKNIDSELSEIERYNIDQIKKYEQAQN